MRLKNILNKRKQAESKLNVPKVIFEDPELQINTGLWLGVISPQQIYNATSFKGTTKKSIISKKKEKEISIKFGQLLSSIGINNSETCTLYDGKKLSFKCHFENKDEDADIILKLDDAMLIIDYGNEKISYNYFMEENERAAELLLESIIIKNNNYTFKRYFFTFDALLFLENDDYTLQIKIDIPESIHKQHWDRYIFKLNNEDELQRYLQSLTFPIDIKEVYKKVLEISLDPTETYPIIKLDVTNRENGKVTDTILFRYGNLIKFTTTTEDDKTISIDGEGNWSCTTPRFSLNQFEGEISYSIHISTDELADLPHPSEQYDTINDEVEEVRLSAKGL